MKRLITLLVALGALSVLSLGALAQEYPVVDGPVTVSDSSIVPGSTITVSGVGFEPGETVTITIESDPLELATVEADAAGAFEVEVTIPADFPGGVHTIKATGPAAGGGTLVLGTQVTVEGSLAETGNTLPLGLLVVAAIALVAGGVAVRAAKA